jgi:hypothetical protein
MIGRTWHDPISDATKKPAHNIQDNFLRAPGMPAVSKESRMDNFAGK